MELLEVFKNQDAIICTIATASAKLQERFIDMAIKAGVKRFVPSEFGSDVRNEKARAIMPSFLQGKLDTVEYLKSKEEEGLTWTSFVTGPFFDLLVFCLEKLLEQRLTGGNRAMAFGYMGFDLKQQKAVMYDDGETKWSTTTLARIGLAVKNAMLISEQTANKYLFIDSFTVSQKEVLAAFEKASGKQWEVSHADLENDKKDGMEKMTKGDMSGAANLIRYINLTPGHGGNYMEYEEGANKLLSLPKETLDQVVSRFV